MDGIELGMSTYYSAFGITGLDSLIRSDPPSIWNLLWIGIFEFFLLPSLFIFNLNSGILETSISEKFIALGLGLEQFQIVFVSVYFTVTYKRMKSIVLDFYSFHSVQHCGPVAEEMIGSRAKVIKKVQRMYFIITFICFLTWSTAPIVLSPKSLFLGENLDKMVKVAPAAYPFRIDYVPMAQIIYVTEVIMTMGILGHFISLNLFFFTALVMVCQLFEILNRSILKEDGRNPMNLKLFVIDHQRLLSICKEIRALLSPLLAVQLLNSLVTICFATFEMTIVNENHVGSQVVEIVKKSINSFFLFAELLFFCWISSELQASCDSVREGLYFNPWEEKLDSENCKYHIIINNIALRPFQLTALGTVNITLGTFIEVIRASYSYYTMLKKMNSM
ncbi:hypothetical protein O3M35_002832 [Rhynocoris fuscipes]|uniref:Odorant receptor n=1 Tax=Rhynocoris fuscipes TaxID=488301 RepID=A0AAW1CUD9_9HEMI